MQIAGGRRKCSTYIWWSLFQILVKIGKYSLLQISEEIQRYQIRKCQWKFANSRWKVRDVQMLILIANIGKNIQISEEIQISKISYTEIPVKICKHWLAGPSLRGGTIDLFCKYQKSPSPLGLLLVGIMDHLAMVDVAFILMTMIVMTMMLRMFASAKAT